MPNTSSRKIRWRQKSASAHAESQLLPCGSLSGFSGELPFGSDEALKCKILSNQVALINSVWVSDEKIEEKGQSIKAKHFGQVQAVS